MDTTYEFHSRITYSLTIACAANCISIKLQARDLRFSKTFQKMVGHDD